MKTMLRIECLEIWDLLDTDPQAMGGLQLRNSCKIVMKRNWRSKSSSSSMRQWFRNCIEGLYPRLHLPRQWRRITMTSCNQYKKMIAPLPWSKQNFFEWKNKKFNVSITIFETPKDILLLQLTSNTLLLT